MKCEVEEVDACNRKLKIEIPLGDYQSKIKAYYQKLGREVKVPGFPRQGADVHAGEAFWAGGQTGSADADSFRQHHPGYPRQ